MPNVLNATGGLITGVAGHNLARRNGGFEVWQRGAGGAASFAIAASGGGVYTADGWYLFNGANQASVVSQVAGLTNGSQWAAKVLRNNGQTGTTAMRFGFPLDTDEIYPLLGQFVRLSSVLKAGANWSPTSGTLSMQFNVGTAAPAKSIVGYTSLTQPIVAGENITTTATQYQATSSVFIPTTTQQAEVTFFWTPVGTAGADDSFTIDDVQLEIVPNTVQQSSAFERLLFEEQLLLCQRHFQKTFLYGTAPAQSAGVDTGEFFAMAGKVGALGETIPARWLTPMRVTPALTTYNPAAANAQARDETAAADCSALATTITANGVRIAVTGAAGTAIGNTLGVHLIADSGI